MTCPSCGRENREGAKFCKGCGANVAGACPSCGADLDADATFCDLCGSSLTGTPQPKRTPTPQPSPALPTSFVGGRYQVQRFLGEGGRKRVYLAHDARLDRDVAIAVIKTDGLDAEGLTRVRHEAQAMGRLGDHQHIVTVHDIGEEDGQPYIVSQYMAGGDLEGLLREAEGHRLPIDHAVRITNQVRQALEYAHGRGIIHRDLKPGNIWMTADGTAKLGDFGLAVALDRSRVTMAGMMLGTVAYMPPEQALGRQADARSDLYSLGCVLYEMVTGRPPFLGDDTVAIISQHINTAPVAPTWHNPDVPRALESLVMRLLAKNPDERPESASAILDALGAIMETASTVAERVTEEVANPLDRLAGGIFVGREKEMDELRAGLEDALSGRGRLLMLVGEPGIGKTRTSEEFATYAGLRNAQVLWGRCYEGEGAPAYWPWVQLIRSYVHDSDPQELASQMGPGAADIAEVVSEVRERLPGLPTPPALEPEQARFRLFDSITTFLKNASKRQPITLILDDLHWADKPSLLLLQFLARELRGARLMVLGTYRDVELGRQHPLSQTLGELGREGLSQRILLRGLTQRDVARFIEITSGVKPPEALVAAVYQETEGNPFFVNEIVRLLVADGRLEKPEEVASWSVTIPQGVREVVGRRLDHLSQDCNRVLTIGSVIGREFGLRALERVSDLSGDRLLEALEEAVGARVIAEKPESLDYYSFSHALIRETLYEELSTARRVRLHRQIGDVLEELYSDSADPHLAELAYHFAEAAPGGDVDKAMDYARRAGQRALSLLAYEEAVGHYERALQTLELKTPPDEELRCELLLALGDAQMKAGDAVNGRQTFERAAESARKRKSADQLARAGLGVGERYEIGAVDESLVEILEEALRLLGDADSALRAMVLGRLAGALYFTGSRERRESLTRESVKMARRLGDSAALAYTLISRHQALWDPEDVEERLSATDEILRLAAEANDKGLTVAGRLWRLVDLIELGDVPALDAEIEALAGVAEELRQPVYLYNLALVRGMRASLDGRFEEAERLAQEALAIGRRVLSANAIQFFAVQTYLLRREQGRLHELEAGMNAFVDQYPLVPAWRCGRALLCCELGQEEKARADFEFLARDDFSVLPHDANWYIGMALLAETCAYLGDVQRAAVLYDQLLPYAERWINTGAGVVCNGSVSRYLGLLAATMSRWEEAERHFEDALEKHAKMGARPYLAHTQREYAEMLLDRGEPGGQEKALGLATQALDTAQELGMKTLVERCLRLKLRAQGIDAASSGASIDAVAASVYVDKPDLRPHAAPDGTVTILFSDIEGSTEMTERLGDQKWMEVLREHNKIVRRNVKAHGGFEVKSEGDGFMLAFQSARKALQCAIETQRAFAERNRSAHPVAKGDSPGREPVEGSPERSEGRAEGDTPAHPSRASGRAGGDVGAAPKGGIEPIRVRIGLHTGEVIREGEDFFGKHVNLAARIAAQAEGGQILISSLLKELTESAGDIPFGEEREVALKGLSGTHRVFPVAWG
ncbi:MAG: protein kinase [Dehalococcoidia bacterium]|nr:protein kinase [Dehalococcoidia bacterium]